MICFCISHQFYIIIGLLEFMLYFSLSIINCITKAENLVNVDALSRISISDELYFILYKVCLIFVSTNEVNLFEIMFNFKLPYQVEIAIEIFLVTFIFGILNRYLSSLPFTNQHILKFYGTSLALLAFLRFIIFAQKVVIFRKLVIF